MGTQGQYSRPGIGIKRPAGAGAKVAVRRGFQGETWLGGRLSGFFRFLVAETTDYVW
ncbi:hypothetical protein RRSWK_00188 [Rhodopirellula sp. SWK7]|nr:hypothetical protein RRSWK_00188 [Rhodopirellula sp. SWK7]